MDTRERDVNYVAERFGYSPDTIRRWARSGKLKAHRRGDDWRFLDEDLAPTPWVPPVPSRPLTRAQLAEFFNS